MTAAVIYLPGVPAPSNHLVEAAELLAEIEWCERLGFETTELEAQVEALIERHLVEMWFGVRL